MTQQQVQRYERDGWQKASLWRLAEAANGLKLDLSIWARLPASSRIFGRGELEHRGENNPFGLKRRS